MKLRNLLPMVAIFFLLLVVTVACSSTPEETPTQPPPPTKEAGAENPTAPVESESGMSGAVSDLQDVKTATVQIEAQGTFVDPEVGLMQNTAGRGSGLIIDPSGIAVTNNHVVTGAALLQVWVGGESEPRNAKVLGVSECSDLAVIDIDGDGYPYLEWLEGSINVGLDVYVAGYPLGDPEYTLTRGVISKAKADGETNWASVDSVLEYDANSNPGNSGGPVVDENGKVVAIHYAGNSGARQAFGIAGELAQDVITELRQGRDRNSIGINGTAVRSEDGSISGIWVSSVKSGSPADEAGVEPGDILVSMERLVLATDGTMADYCDILRSHNPDDTLAIEVLRFSTQEMLEGQLNGRKLEQQFSFSQELQNQVEDAPPPADTSSPSAAGYANYVTVSDDFGSMQMNIPDAWTEIDGSPWVSDQETIGASLAASSNLVDFYNTWGEPGVIFRASDDLANLGGYVQLLDIFREDFVGVCDLEGRYDYEDEVYEGKYDLFINCGGTETVYIVLSSVPKSDRDAFLVVVEVQIVNDRDLEALDQILTSFDVVSALP